MDPAAADPYYVNVLQDKPLIHSKKAAIIVDAYEKKPEAIKWLEKYTACYRPLHSFEIANTCFSTSHNYTDNNLLTLSPLHMLEYGYTQDNTPVPTFAFPTRKVVNDRELYSPPIRFCYNNISPSDSNTIKALITLPPEKQSSFVGFVCLICMIIAENKNIELFKALLNQEQFATAIAKNSFRILQNICKSNVDTLTFSELLETYCFNPLQSMSCPANHTSCIQRGSINITQGFFNDQKLQEMRSVLQQYEKDYCKASKNNILKDKQAEGKKFIDKTKKTEADEKSFFVKYFKATAFLLCIASISIGFAYYLHSLSPDLPVLLFLLLCLQLGMSTVGL